MNESTEKLLLVLGGAILGSLGVLAFSKNSGNLRPTLTKLTADALNLRDKAVGTIQRTKEDVSDFIAEVDHARNAKTEPQAEAEPQTEQPAAKA